MITARRLRVEAGLAARDFSLLVIFTLASYYSFKACGVSEYAHSAARTTVVDIGATALQGTPQAPESAHSATGLAIRKEQDKAFMSLTMRASDVYISAGPSVEQTGRPCSISVTPSQVYAPAGGEKVAAMTASRLGMGDISAMYVADQAPANGTSSELVLMNETPSIAPGTVVGLGYFQGLAEAGDVVEAPLKASETPLHTASGVALGYEHDGALTILSGWEGSSADDIQFGAPVFIPAGDKVESTYYGSVVDIYENATSGDVEATYGVQLANQGPAVSYTLVRVRPVTSASIDQLAPTAVPVEQAC